jgi:hypothetical protein
MRRDLDTRLSRVARAKGKAASPRDLTEVRHRAVLRARVAVCALLRRKSVPADAHAVRLGDAAAIELSRIPETPDLRSGDAALIAHDHGAVRGEFEAKMARVVRQYRDGRELDPARASPADLLASCIVDALDGQPPAATQKPGG